MSGPGELDWDDLRYFLQAVRARTLVGAARATGVEHTTVGRRLSSLEDTLGAPLVLRGPEGLRLTPLGERVVPLVERMESTVQALCALVETEKTRVRLAVPSGFTKLFTAALPALQARAPGVSLELISGARPVDLTRGEADLAIRSGPVADKELVSRKLCDAGFSLYAADRYLARRPYTAGARELSGHDVIGFDPSLAGLPAASWLEQHAGGANMVLRSREMTDMLEAAASGLGLAILPCLLGDAEPRLRRLTPECLATRPISLVRRREARLSREVKAVVRFVVEVMEQHAARIGGRADP